MGARMRYRAQRLMKSMMPTTRLNFQLDAQDSSSCARAGTFSTLHDTVKTPVFMPVATAGVIRNQRTDDVEEAGFLIILANTYHLILRPGREVLQRCSGLGKFMNWKRSILTDSGGFQVFSLAHSARLEEEGAFFKSYIDGRTICLSPESSIAAQLDTGSDIMMAMDQCVPSTADEPLIRCAVERTARWAERSLAARGDSARSLFGIVQGGCVPSLRKISAGHITSLPFDGFAIGGLAVGESEEERKEMTEVTAALLPKDSPRYLMGVGTPSDILEAVARGVDMFDCIIPTLFGEQGICWTSRGRLDLRRGVYRGSDRPVDEACLCPACTRYSRSYLHHLVKCGEYFGKHLLGLHNLVFYRTFMDDVRESIINGAFSSFYNTHRDSLRAVDEEFVRNPPGRKHRPARELGDYEIISRVEGFHSIRQKSSGEVMHSVSRPLEEAMQVYVIPADIDGEIEKSGPAPVVVWDAGLGAAANAMALIFHLEKRAGREQRRPVHILSFERDMDPLRLSLRHSALFPHLHHPAPFSLLEKGKWISRDHFIEWHLREGDFLARSGEAPSPSRIFYDLFSLNTEPELWTEETFANIFRKCEHPARLHTYSASTRVRCSLLAAGFYVAKGPATGPKEETTIAYSSPLHCDARFEMLGNHWLERLERSGCEISPGLRDRAVKHPQFADCFTSRTAPAPSPEAPC